MIDKHETEKQRHRIEQAVLELAPGDRLWLEVHRSRRPGSTGWKAVVCRPEAVRAEFAAAGLDGAFSELDGPSQLAEWLAALGVRPVQPAPDDWNNVVFFGRDVEVSGRESSEP